MTDKKDEPKPFEVDCEKWKKGKEERKKEKSKVEALEKYRDPVYGSDEWFEIEKKRVEENHKDRQIEQNDLFEDMDNTFKSHYFDAEDYIMKLLPDYKGSEDEGDKGKKSNNSSSSCKPPNFPETQTLTVACEVEKFKECAKAAAKAKTKENAEWVKKVEEQAIKRHEEEAQAKEKLKKARAERDEKLEKEREAERKKNEEERQKKIQQLQQKIGSH